MQQKIPIEILVLNEVNKNIVHKSINFLNAVQTTFYYSILEGTLPEDRIHKRSILFTEDVYQYLEKLQFEIKGYHPHIICVTDKYLNGDLTNLYASMDRKNGILTGYSIVTSYQVEEIISEIPIEVYFQFYFLIQSLRFLVKKEMGHKEIRFCIYDEKIHKRDLYAIMRYGTFCLECNDIIRSLINSEQMQSVRKTIGIISDISYSNNPFESYDAVYNKIQTGTIQTKDRNENLIQSFDEAIEFIKKSDTEKAFNKVSLIIKNQHPSKYNEAIILHSRLNKVNSEFRSGLIKINYRNLEINNINRSLLELIDEIKTDLTKLGQ